MGKPRGVATLRIMRSIAMKFLSKKQVKELVLYSFAHTARLEEAGKFPRRIRLGQARVAYVEQEVLDWMQARLSERDAQLSP
jgi:prophage regulatory protein